MTHICVGKLIIIDSDNGLSPGRRRAIIWTSAGILLTGRLGTNFSEILIGIQTFSLKKMSLKMSSVKWCTFCLGLKVLISVLWWYFKPPYPLRIDHKLILGWHMSNSLVITSRFWPHKGKFTQPVVVYQSWASFQIRKVAGCACAGNAGNVFPRDRL